MKIAPMKAVILIAGPQKGTRFRPMSLDVPKPLFPVAGWPIIRHHVEALSKVDAVTEILVLGSYPNDEMAPFIAKMTDKYCSSAAMATRGRSSPLSIRYLQEYTSLGTAGGIFHFRDRILAGDPDSFFVLNGDVCAQFPLQELVDFHYKSEGSLVTLMATEATRQQSLNYGCVVRNAQDDSLQHYVEKPETYVSTLINCGVYVFSKDVFPMLKDVYKRKQLVGNGEEAIWVERDILPALAGNGTARVYQTTNWWSQLKTAGAAIYANRHYLELFKTSCPQRLASDSENGSGGSCGPKIVGNVFVHRTAKVDPSAVLGPNVSIGRNVTVGAGTRVRESIVLDNASVGRNSLVMHTVICRDVTVGDWTRVEGTPNDPNPDKPFAKMENVGLFGVEGKLNPAVTILGCNVTVPSEIVVLNSVVLPHKQISHSLKNEIIL